MANLDATLYFLWPRFSRMIRSDLGVACASLVTEMEINNPLWSLLRWFQLRGVIYI